MIDIGVARPSALGASDDQHSDGRQQGIRKPRLRTPLVSVWKLAGAKQPIEPMGGLLHAEFGATEEITLA
jgi:hypothetical protein